MKVDFVGYGNTGGPPTFDRIFEATLAKHDKVKGSVTRQFEE